MKKPTVSEIAALWDKATPGDWIVRTHPEKDDFFVEAPAAMGEPYGTEILGDEDYPTKRADAEAIVKAKAYHPYLLDLVERMGKALDEYGDHTAPCDVSDTTCTCGWEKARALLEELRNSDD